MLFHLVRLQRRLRRQRSLCMSCILGLLAVSILGNSACYHYFDGQHKGQTVGDAIWYSFISITTIGYGDISAQSMPARLATIVFVVGLGLAVFSVVLGTGIEWVSENIDRTTRGLGKAYTKDHVIIVNFPSEARVRQIIRELRSDSEYRDKDIVIVSDSIEKIPFSDEEVIFIRGPVLEQETYERADAREAKMAIVLATSYHDTSSDAVVASAVSVLNHMNADSHIVAECLNPKHRSLFESVHCDAVVFSMQISGNLLAQEVHDPGISQLMDTITSNAVGTTLYSTWIPGSANVPYQELARKMLDLGANMLCVNRHRDCITCFRDAVPQEGDRIVYIGTERWDWDEMRAALNL